ncbi:Peptidase, M23/M37 family [hydrothermal vent metagenome]|uniref:Peptidase, M23/M37 family n=1 Tax=hydrothermal vent metagenome TaxID=652676 RepID=A0A1W1BPT3_9ZZZZ
MRIFLFLFFINFSAFAFLDVENTPIAGGIAVINFKSNHTQPTAFFYKNPVFVQKIKDNYWQALVGIPLLTKIGKKHLIIKDFSTRTIDFEVVSHTYKSQYITLKGKKKKYVDPLKKHIKRIIKERKVLTQARKTFSASKKLSNNFILPVKGIISSPFGLKRFYNNKPRNPHSGLDFAAKLNTKIIAPMNGTIILTGHYFFNGKTVFIDHGQGLISAYIHMNKIKVKKGDYVKKGDIIGTVGKTGRSTGPHLHWGIYLNKTAINPYLLTNLKNDTKH